MAPARQSNSRDDSTLKRIIAAKHCGTAEWGKSRHRWTEIGRTFDLPWTTVRARYIKRDKLAYPEASMPAACPICQDDLAHSTKSEVAVEGNYATATSTDGRVRTEEDLRAACQIDASRWRCIHFKAGTWEAYAADEDKDLVFEDGVISGHSKRQGLIVQTLFRTEGRFVRREPKPLRPVVQPVACPAMYRKPRPPARGGVKRGLMYADPQFGFARDLRTGKLTPFHDRLALDIVVQVAAMVQPAVVILAGDVLDLTLWTDKFVRSAAYYFTTQPAILEAHRHLREMREVCKGAAFYLLEGNHDARMRAALSMHLHEACELRPADEVHLPPAMSPPRLLALHRLGIEWVGDYPDGEVWLGPLRVQHGATARKPPGSTARAVSEEGDVHTAFGHVHRKELVSRRVQTRDGVRTVKTYCPGCTCRVDGTVPGSSKRDNWQQGFAVIDYDETDFTIYDVEIRDGRAIYDGRVFQGRDPVADLRRDLAEWNW